MGTREHLPSTRVTTPTTSPALSVSIPHHFPPTSTPTPTTATSTIGYSGGSGSGGDGAGPSSTLNKPSSLSEWQLYTVLHRANLLQYYDTFITQGGDDVQQLLEAGEEEFLEIMALVGMATKPLHVRRLQKTLQEFSVNPGRFQLLSLQHQTAAGSAPPLPLPLPPASLAGPLFGSPSTPTSSAQISPHFGSADPPPRTQPHSSAAFLHRRGGTPQGGSVSDSPGPSDMTRGTIGLSLNPSLGGHTTGGFNWSVHGSGALGFGPGLATANILPGAEIGGIPSGSAGSGEYDFGSPDPPGGPTPTLTETQIQKLTECANEIVKTLPAYEPKLVQNKKKISRELLGVMEMGAEDPFRLDEFRRYAAIYGRFDTRRKPDKPLTLHEVSVNEAAAQICLHRPALLTRRDELFPLARQAVKNAGYNYSKSANKSKSSDTDETGESGRKRRRSGAESADSSGEERSQTPSSMGGTPPGPSTSSLETHLTMVGSPSSSVSGTSGGNGGPFRGGYGFDPDNRGRGRPSRCAAPAGAMGLHVPVLDVFGHGQSGRLQKYFVEFQGLDQTGRKRKMESLGLELKQVVMDQDAAKNRVVGTHDMGELIRIQSDLGQLTQRQMDISDRQAALLSLLAHDDQRPHTHSPKGNTQPDQEKELREADMKEEGIKVEPLEEVEEGEERSDFSGPGDRQHRVTRRAHKPHP